MEMTGCGKFTRILMFLSNFVIWAGSIVLLVFGVLNVVERPYLEKLLGGNIYSSAAYILIIVGCVSFFVSFLGCFGALKEIKCMLLLYFIIVLLLFIVLLIGGILGYVFRGKAESSVMKAMTVSMREYTPNSDQPLTLAWDETQLAMQCCGMRDYNDWISYNNHFDLNGVQIPESCCKMDDDGMSYNCQNDPTDPDLTFQGGCYTKATSFIKSNSLIIGGVGVAVAILMLFGLVFSLVLFKLIK